jgi:hypothetical protein
MRRQSLSAVEECYRGSAVRVFRLRRDTLLADLEKRSRRLLDDRPEVVEIRLFGSLVTGQAGPGSDADIRRMLEILRIASRSLHYMFKRSTRSGQGP